VSEEGSEEVSEEVRSVKKSSKARRCSGSLQHVYAHAVTIPVPRACYLDPSYTHPIAHLGAEGVERAPGGGGLAFVELSVIIFASVVLPLESGMVIGVCVESVVAGDTIKAKGGRKGGRAEEVSEEGRKQLGTEPTNG
jgi:hypothetical protein